MIEKLELRCAWCAKKKQTIARVDTVQYFCSQSCWEYMQAAKLTAILAEAKK